MFFLRGIYIVFLGFFPCYQYAMNEKVVDGNDKEESLSENSKKDQSIFTFILTAKRNGLGEEIEKEEEDIKTKKYQLEKELINLENEKYNLGTEGYEKNYKKVEEYVSEIDARVKKKYTDKIIYEEIDDDEIYGKIDKKIDEEGKEKISYEESEKIEADKELMKQKFVNSLKTILVTHSNTILRPKVMCGDKFNDFFDQFKDRIDKKIAEDEKPVSFYVRISKKGLQRAKQLYDFEKSEEGRSRYYRFFRNALYRQGCLLFYNTARVISNAKIEYDLWRSDTGKHMWGVNSSANVYYKYRSAWDYRVFKFSLFYIEFSFGLFHLLLKPLKRISEWVSFPSSVGGDVHRIPILNGSGVPFWDMINISLVQISVGPVGINGLRFSLFDPIFFIMSLLPVAYFCLSKSFLSEMHEIFKYLSTYEVISIPKEVPEVIYKLKKALKKFNFVKPRSRSAFIEAFSLYLFKKSILLNIIGAWKKPYNKGFYIDIVFYTFVRILKSAPEIFKEIPTYGVKPMNTIHEVKIIETHYLNGSVYDPTCAGRCGFRGLCDMFFLSLALLVYSMIDSISIDLRWFIANESVREYCTRIKRKVCSFFK